MEEEPQIIQGAPSEINEATENFVELFKNQEEQVQSFNKKSKSLETQIEKLKGVIQNLESEKSELDADITNLRLRNIAFQKEHTNLRNSITVIKFQIEKIKESIAKAKATDLKNLEDFEKAIDEITEKFRSGPNIYDRKVLMEDIQKEKEKKDYLSKKLDEVRSLYETFCKEKGLRVRKDENEELLSCILPGSELSCLMEMTKTLQELRDQKIKGGLKLHKDLWTVASKRRKNLIKHGGEKTINPRLNAMGDKAKEAGSKWENSILTPSHRTCGEDDTPANQTD